MAFDLDAIRKELAAAPLPSPYPADLAAAIVDDTFRMSRLTPLPAGVWKKWIGKGQKNKLFSEQLGMLAHILAVTSLRTETTAALQKAPGFEPQKALEGFFETIAPLTAEMIRANAFRQEEFLRKWAEAVGGSIQGEKAEQSRKRLEQLDYRKTLEEYNQAERTRKAEAERRAKALQEAAAREAAARGWRE